MSRSHNLRVRLNIYVSERSVETLRGQGTVHPLCRTSIDSLHRLNMELALQSLFGLHVHSCTHWLRPSTPHPAFGLIIYEGAIGRSAKIDDIFWKPPSFGNFLRRLFTRIGFYRSLC
jgi:hypothetical protein